MKKRNRRIQCLANVRSNKLLFGQKMNERKKPREYIKIELENLDSANKQNERKKTIRAAKKNSKRTKRIG